MRYNWDRAPTDFERHRKALAAALLIAGGVGLMLAALPLSTVFERKQALFNAAGRSRR